MPGFDEATSLRARPDGAGFDAQVDPDWTVAGRPNGGYLAAILALAATRAARAGGRDHPHPMSMSATYLRPPATGPGLVRTEVLRLGRTASQVRAAFEQDGQVCVDAVLVLVRLSEGSERRVPGPPAPTMPPEETCRPLAPAVPHLLRMATMAQLDLRLDPATAGFLDGQPGGEPELRAWLRWMDGREPDPVSLLFALDALPPATFEIGSTGWVPTLQLTSYVRALPAPGPLLVRQRAQLVLGGFVDELCHVWDASGRLVAQATQLAGVRFPGEADG